MSALRVRLAVPALLLLPLLPALAPGASAEDGPVVSTVVGNPGKQGPALQVAMNPYALALRGDRVLIADASNGVIRSLDVDAGTLTTVAGLGGGAYPAELGDGAPAREVQIGSPVSLAVAQDGSFVFGDGGGGGAGRARRVMPDGTIRVVAGNGAQAFSGDGGPATAAAMYRQGGLALSGDGSVWISDTYNNRVRRVTPDGIIRTVAGTGATGFAGDGGLATAAVLDQPKGLDFTAGGDLLVADSGNNRIRRISADGVITTVAGSGPSGGSTFGDGRGAQGDGGPATSAALHAPSAARPLPDGGYLIADTLNHKIRRVAPDGTISTVAGGGERHYGRDDVPALDTNLFAPEDVLPLPDGRFVIADTRAGRVRVVGTDGIIRAAAGNYRMAYSGDGGPGRDAQSSGTRRVVLAPDGDLYFADFEYGWVVRRLEASDGTVHPVAGYSSSQQDPTDASPALTTFLTHVSAVALQPDGGLLIAENSLIRRVDPATGQQRVWAGSTTGGDAGDGGHRSTALFQRVSGLHVLPNGDVLVVDPGANRVRRISPDGLVSPLAGTGVGGFSGDGGPATHAQLREPSDAIADAAGTIFIADEQNERLRAISPDGTIRTVAGDGVHGTTDKRVPGPALEARIRPGSLAVLPDGRILIADLFACSVYAFDRRDSTVRQFAGTGRSGFADGPAGTAMFSFVDGLAVDTTRRVVYIGDVGNGRVRTVTFTDTTTSVSPAPTPASPVPSSAPSPNTGSSPRASSSPSATPNGSPTPAPRAPEAPRLSLSPATISAGQATTVTYRGEPFTTLDILSRTQPATVFSKIGTVQLDRDGFGTSTHRPQKNTRITARTSSGQMSTDAPIVGVRSVATFNVTRVGVRTYTFTGRVYPALNNRLVNIYRNGALVGQPRSDASGIYKVTRTLGAGTSTFQARTRDDQSNLGTNSPVRQVTIR